MRTLLSGSLFLLLMAGCTLVGSGPAVTAQWTVHVLPVAPTSQQSTAWTEETWAKRTTCLASVFVDTGLDWDIDKIRFLEKPEWTILNDHTRLEMQAYALREAMVEGKLVVFLCNEAWFDGNRVAGLANLPTNNPTEAYGIWLDRLGQHRVLAHEMGHSFGLLHPEHPTDCLTNRCNIMAYCSTIVCDKWLSPGQVDVVRQSVSLPTRWLVVTPR